MERYAKSRTDVRDVLTGKNPPKLAFQNPQADFEPFSNIFTGATPHESPEILSHCLER